MPDAQVPQMPTRDDLLGYLFQSRLVSKLPFIGLLSLILRCDPTTHYSCELSIESLARDSHCSPNSARRAIKHLEACKLIARQLRPGLPCKWFVNARLLQETAEANRAKEATLGLVVGSPFTVPRACVPQDAAGGEDAESQQLARV
jgi:hypothetical protein